MQAIRAHRYLLASLAGLAAALIALAYVVVVALNGIGAATSGLCHDPPSLTGSISQGAIVVVSAACFVAGHIVSWAGARHRPELNHRLGEDAWSDRRAVLVVKTALALILAVLSTLLALEAVMIYRHIWPITLYVRCSNEANSYIALLGVSSFAFLVGRWFWIPK
jgi:hypothetical protein